jgi:hypothetical protein
LGQGPAELVAGSLGMLAERVGDPTPQVYARLFAEFRDAIGEAWTAEVDAAWAELLARLEAIAAPA